MNYTNNKELYAVYGTLKQGHGNHNVILAKNPIQTEKIKGFKMYTNGAFPMIVPASNKNEILIEIYEVSDVNTKMRLDRLEGYNPVTNTGMYIRKQIDTSLGKAWIYVWNRGVDNYDIVKNGDFSKNYAY
jgi:gamma-glutamylcyclotransferase (GGCT)/AIG2-like uncharacterized protein YtfP